MSSDMILLGRNDRAPTCWSSSSLKPLRVTGFVFKISTGPMDRLQFVLWAVIFNVAGTLVTEDVSMGFLSARSTLQAELFQALLTRRSRPCIMVLDVDLNVAFADSQALALLETHFQLPERGMLPVVLRDTIAEIIRRWDENAVASEQSIGPVSGLILRLVSLSGQYGSLYALLFEKEARREDLKDAVTRFSLTPREVEVLDLILDGMSAAEIAKNLHIAEVTVFDHFKHINDKTNARNRADMLAKIFNWQPALRSNALGKNGVDRRISSRQQNDLGA